MLKLLTDPLVFSTLLGGATWLANKVFGKKAETKAAKVAAAIATSSALMVQLVYTAPSSMTVERLILQCKGVVAIQLAKVGITESNRAPYQPLIDRAIAEAIAKFVSFNPSSKVPIAAMVAIP